MNTRPHDTQASRTPPGADQPSADMRASLDRRHLLPWSVVVLVAVAMIWYGPIPQLENYNDFADHRSWLGIPNAGDVLSNVGFAVVGWYGLALILHTHDYKPLAPIRPGYTLFFVAMILTAFGSGWYHLVPNNARLVWDRLPIALLCAGILSAVWRETLKDGRWVDILWAVFAIFGVFWWWYTDHRTIGDLRPYLYIQILTLLLVPLLQWQHKTPVRERLYFGAAIALYVLAKIAELMDRQIFHDFGFLSGHTIKHLLSVAAGVAILLNYLHRKKELERPDGSRAVGP